MHTRSGSCPSPSPAALWTLLALSGAACAPALGEGGVPAAGEIPHYEARLARDTADVATLVPLAAAYRDAGRIEEARALLERAVALRPHDPGAAMLLGLTYEDLEQPARAAPFYERAARQSRSPGIRAQARGRARLAQRQQWLVEARSALAREAELAAAPPEPRTIAVLPFLFQGEDGDFQPLGRALAEMLVTDLSQVDRLRVLERSRVQLLLQEARLAEEGLVEPSTAARSGRLLRAERIVQGRVQEQPDALELHAAIVEVRTPQGIRIDPLTERDAVQRFFDMQKRLVFGMFGSLAIELTPAERARIARRPTENLQALLAYGTGLGAEDAGAWDNAAQHFARAAALDPGFELARARAATAAAAARAEGIPTRQLTAQALAEFGAIEAGLAAVEELIPQVSGRDAASEALGQEHIGSQGAVLRLIVRPRQGGGR